MFLSQSESFQDLLSECLRQSPPLNQMQQPIKQWRQRLNNIADIKLFQTLNSGGSRSPNVFDALRNLKPSFLRIMVIKR